MKRKYRELLIRLNYEAAEDQNYFVGGYEGDAQRAQGFFYPGRELLISYIWAEDFLWRRELEVYNVSAAEQDFLCELSWRISKPISAIDRIARVTNPMHMTIFSEDEASLSKPDLEHPID